MPNENTLKPCPFCGGKAVLYVLPEGGICVTCFKCRARTNVKVDYLDFTKPTNATKKVVEAWNRRVEDA